MLKYFLRKPGERKRLLLQRGKEESTECLSSECVCACVCRRKERGKYKRWMKSVLQAKGLLAFVAVVVQSLNCVQLFMNLWSTACFPVLYQFTEFAQTHVLPPNYLSLFSSTTVQKQQFWGTQPSLWSKSHIHIWLLEKKNIALTKQTLKKGHFPLFSERTLVLIGMEANWRSFCHVPCVVCVYDNKWCCLIIILKEKCASKVGNFELSCTK